MGDLPNLHDQTSFSLIPGYQFFPSEQQLICHYLTSKNTGANLYGADVIKEFVLYSFDPFSLPESASYRFGREGCRRHWYFYVVRRDRGRRRAAGGGYWMKRGRSKNVVNEGAGKVVVGRRKCFVFYSGNSESNAVKTPLVMYEYAPLIDHHLISFVLCRVFFKRSRASNLSELVISSCGGDSVGTIRHFGVQCDRPDTSKNVATKLHDNNAQDDDNKNSSFPKGLDGGLDPQATHMPVLDQEFLASLEDDFIELDDLLSPLPGTD